MQQYIEGLRERQFNNTVIIESIKIGCLTYDFNLFYQILHMYGHFEGSRNNIKQFIDYYYLLKKSINKYNKEDLRILLKKMGVIRYARGVMWIMYDFFALGEKYLYEKPDEDVGRLIFDEAMKFGTFSQNKYVQMVQKLPGNIRIMRYFPSMVLISPLFFIWHQWWKWGIEMKLKFQ